MEGGMYGVGVWQPPPLTDYPGNRPEKYWLGESWLILGVGNWPVSVGGAKLTEKAGLEQ